MPALDTAIVHAFLGLFRYKPYRVIITSGNLPEKVGAHSDVLARNFREARYLVIRELRYRHPGRRFGIAGVYRFPFA